MDRRLIGARQRIDNLEARARAEPVSTDDELKAQMAQFLCVLSSGLLEEAVRLTLSGFAKTRSSPEVASYVTANLEQFQNPRFEKIMILLGSFDPKWRSHFEDGPSNEVKDAIDSIVVNRHQIAHGRPVGISIVTFSKYYKQVCAFIDDLDALVTS
ncbi:MAG: HEPN domain-containing protein [Acidobacteriaceae bacterium]|jgi:hypothetical protein